MSIITDIQTRLASVRKKLLDIELRSLVLRGISLIAGVAAIILILEVLFQFNSSIRTMEFMAVTVLMGAVLVLFFFRPALKRLGLLAAPPDSQLAHLVGEAFPQVRDRLLNLLQLQEERNRGTLYSADLIDASFQDLASATASLDFNRAVDVTPLRRASKFAAVSLAALFFLIVLFPDSIGNAGYRFLRFSQDFVPPARFTFHITPGTTEAIKGVDVSISIKVVAVGTGAIPKEPLSLFWKPEGQNEFEALQTWGDTSDVFNASLASLRATTDYYAEFAGLQSERFRITIVDRPLVRSFQVQLDFPPYTRQPSRVQEEFVGDITALAGTRVRITGTASKDLATGSLRFKQGAEIPLSIRASRFSGQFTVNADSKYALELTDENGLSTTDPLFYEVTVLPDEPPAVTLLEPGRNVDIAGTSSLPLLISIRDDFGFSRLRLGFRLIHSRYERPSETYSFQEIPIRTGTAVQLEVPFVWDFSGLKLVPEDVVEYFAEIFDNDAVRGPKSSRSQVFLLRLPSLEEVFTDLDTGHEETLEDLRKTAEEAKELRKNVESIQEDFKKNKDIDWQQQRKMEETAKKYEELQKKLQDVQSRLENMAEQMQEQNVLSPETMEKYLELQQLFEQLNSAEMQKAMKQLQQAMQNVNKEQLRQALQQLTFSEEQFRQSIERTLDLLKRIQIEQKLDEARKRAEELLKLQKELEAATDQANDPDQAKMLAEKQQDVQKQLDQLKQSAQDVQNRMEEFFTEMPEEELQAAIDRLDSTRADESMRQAASELRSGKRDQARKAQAEIQQALQQFSEDLAQIQMQMLQEQQQYIMNELRRAIKNLLELSAREERLKDQSQTAPQNSSQLRENAQDQMRILQDLQNLVSSLQTLSKRSFAVTPEMGKTIGEALMKMQNSLKALEIRSGGSASQEQRMAMESLNKAAMAVQQSMQDMMQSDGQGGGSGLMGQLQRMAGRQQSLNMRTQGFEEAARLAAEQEALRKSLEQLNAEARASGEQQRILGDLERITQEMREVVEDLEQGNVNPETVQKQERILSRLLDASRSARERDFEKKRKAQTGRQIARPGPAELDPSTLEGKSQLREDLLKALEHGYSRDYQDLIRKYFEELQKGDTP
ncbi:MAG: DUF4175 family protein [Bacteroidota bacterium]